ncbi:hypothetical protein GN244_ATG12650 [Phytophthora infestans]|uniref:Uncharacterized protein n=1 Tax=Phytophthora infestans TaxID=4787 RepID=A0A833T1F0_PHYIN|nr:hypothetical protein GN244_ATG12650 [Phytophthora infestans]
MSSQGSFAGSDPAQFTQLAQPGSDPAQSTQLTQLWQAHAPATIASPFLPREFMPFAAAGSQYTETFKRQLQVAQSSAPHANAVSAALPRSAVPLSRIHRQACQPEADSDSSEEGIIGVLTPDMMAAAPTEAATSSQAPATVPSIDHNEWKADEMRKECTRRKIRLPKGTLKEDRVKALMYYDAKKKKYGGAARRQHATRRA